MLAATLLEAWLLIVGVEPWIWRGLPSKWAALTLRRSKILISKLVCQRSCRIIHVITSLTLLVRCLWGCKVLLALIVVLVLALALVGWHWLLRLIEP